MTAPPSAAGPLVQWVVERLLTGSGQGALVIGVVWLVCRRVTALPASLRALLWWLASLRLVLALLPLPALPLALLAPQAPAPVEIRNVALPDAALPVVGMTPHVAARPEKGTDRVGERPAGALDTRPWVAVVMALWLTGLMIQAVRLLWALHQIRGVASRSAAFPTEDAASARRIADDVGLRMMPEIRVSDEIDSPQVMGVRRPIVLLPATVVTSFTPNQLAMTLCHELMHVRRHDLAFGWVPALAERLFFFHPLARFTAREYVIAREAACDAAVLRALDVTPQEYGRLLMRFGVTQFTSRFAATGASPSTSSLRRRLDMLHHATLGRASRRATWLLASVVALCLLPFQLVARTPTEPVSAASKATAPASGRETAPPLEGGPEGPPLLTETNALRQENAEQPGRAVARQEQIQRRALEELNRTIRAQNEELRRVEQQRSEAQGRDEAQQHARIAEALARRTRQQAAENSQAFDTLGFLEDQLLEAQDRLRAVPVAEREKLVRELEAKIEAVRQQFDSQQSQARVRLRDSERRVDQQTGSLEQQIERLTRAQQQLEQQLRVLAEQQATIAAAQRQLSSQAARILEAVEKAAVAIDRQGERDRVPNAK